MRNPLSSIRNQHGTLIHVNRCGVIALLVGLMSLVLAACALATPTPPGCSKPICEVMTDLAPGAALPEVTPTPEPTLAPSPTPSPAPTETEAPTPTATIPTPLPPVPNFDQIVVIVFENKDFLGVVGNPDMPNLNRLAVEYTLLNNYYAVAHPSLPNYLAMLGGDTFGINVNCEDCFINAPNLADLIEQSGRQWKTYQESMPEPCFIGSRGDYVQKHNPFIYFDSIRQDTERCRARVVPFEALAEDLAAGQLPAFSFITPGLCHSGHDCSMAEMDAWLGQTVDMLRYSPALSQNSLIVVTFDEATGDDSSGCCGLPTQAGGRIATLLISPLARRGFEDSIPYSHYSLLKTIAEAWQLPLLGMAADARTEAIVAPWHPPEPDETVFIGAGDIAVCGNDGHYQTARILDHNPGVIFSLGDNSNDKGTMQQYQNCYAPAWGRHMWNLRPSPGNHDYETENGAAYHAFFGAAAGEPGKGYYSYNLGEWHIIALNSNCAAVGGCGPSSPQIAWLREDLAAHPAACTLAYWHHPRFSSGVHNTDPLTVELWRVLYEAGADVILNGHDHIYERFALQDPDGNPDEANGIRQFTVGTGGAFYRGYGAARAENSQVAILNTFGVLKLTLHRDRYDWRFLPEPGKPNTDYGSGVCH